MTQGRVIRSGGSFRPKIQAAAHQSQALRDRWCADGGGASSYPTVLAAVLLWRAHKWILDQFLGLLHDALAH